MLETIWGHISWFAAGIFTMYSYLLHAGNSSGHCLYAWGTGCNLGEHVHLTCLAPWNMVRAFLLVVHIMDTFFGTCIYGVSHRLRHDAASICNSGHPLFVGAGGRCFALW